MAHEGAILETIGNTPLVELKNLDSGGCRLFAKLENQNPTGSIKDRIGLSMIEAAERDGRLKPGGTLIEATAGNTRSEEHTSELQSLMRISYAVFCLKKKKKKTVIKYNHYNSTKKNNIKPKHHQYI